MHDDRAKLEQTLRERAAEVPYLQPTPPHLVGRARRRIARNALSSVLAVGLLVAGGAVGLANLRTLGGPGPDEVTSGGPPSGGAHARPCTPGELGATASLEGAAGSVLGEIRVTNRGDQTCTLRGRPILTIVDANGETVAVQAVETAPRWKVDRDPVPEGWPVVQLPPRSAAAVRIRWTNACPQLTDPVSWSLDLPGKGGRLEVAGTDTAPIPPCNGPGEPSTLEVGPFEPAVPSGGSA
jgi:hypothetical protein